VGIPQIKTNEQRGAVMTISSIAFSLVLWCVFFNITQQILPEMKKHCIIALKTAIYMIE
jgi:hypothetical protein